MTPIVIQRRPNVLFVGEHLFLGVCVETGPSPADEQPTSHASTRDGPR
jgi:hypothetical protein